ncbi:MAG TPA: hypothetical protein VGJ18_09755 [Gemmatimonadaceae bacterium]|jgi:hypothetical protein
MSALTSVLFPEPTLRRSPGAVIGWWERRRPLYNAVVGATGLVTVSLLIAVAGPTLLVQPGLWLGVTAYGIAANVCYTLGAPLELLLERWLGREAYAVGPTLFRYGLVYSVGLTLFPLALGAFALCAKILFQLFR